MLLPVKRNVKFIPQYMHKFIEKDDTKKKNVKLKDNQLMFVVREPFQSKKTQIGLTTGIIAGQNKLVLESFLPTNGVTFSDGIETDFLNFNSGSIVTIGTAKEKSNLLHLTTNNNDDTTSNKLSC
jgi:hypothetical protein